uniref:NADH dehydrogenase subunit 1 n=1 Tax=Epipenaeon fissurae TaxID=2995643 RepID=UPI0022FD7D84|nr:NADH dehydrogenase subunit 1 [Epipenaeon fissurae]WBK03025.1 NADH dehydrogenase subunit 1 [Epipenaeon fissurae]
MLLMSSLKTVIFLLCTLLNVAFFTLLERKILGYMQIRKGPNKTGMMGLLQPFSDAIKLFSKEVSSLKVSNILIFSGGPLMSLSIMLIVWMSAPFLWSGLEVEISSVFMLCLMSLGVYPIFSSGWSSNSKYSLMGGLRAIAQTISYEVSLALIFLGFLASAGSLSMESFSLESVAMLGLVHPLMAAMWIITCLAETGRSPFDLPEGESELVSGFNTEYSSGMFALFFLGEYGMMIFLSYMSSVILMGGMTNPFLAVTTLLIVFFFIWARGTLPRFRYDLLMNLTWKLFLPVALGYLVFILSFTLYSR